MTNLGLLGIMFAAVGGIILSPPQFAPAIIILACLAGFAFYSTNLPTDFKDAEQRLQRQIDVTQKKLFEIEKDVDQKISRSTARMEVIERSQDHRLTLNEHAIDGLASTLEQRYLRLEHDFVKKIVRIEQRLKTPPGKSQPTLSLLSTGLLAALALLIAIPLWWNFPNNNRKASETPVLAVVSERAPAEQPDARAQLRTPALERDAEGDEREGMQQRRDEQVLVEIKELLASTVRPLETCVNQLSALSAENLALSEKYDARVQKLESKIQACASRLQVTQKIMKDQRRLWFGDEIN